MMLENYGQTVDAQKVVSLAEEAHQFSPSANTAAALGSAHMFKAAQELGQADAAFAFAGDGANPLECEVLGFRIFSGVLDVVPETVGDLP